MATGREYVVLQPSEGLARRPLGVTVVGALQVLGGIVLLLLGGFLVVAARTPRYFSPFLLVLGAILLGLSALTIILAWGVFSGKRWAWTWTVIIQVFNLAIGLFALLLSPFGGSAILVSILILAIMFSHDSQTYFRKSSQAESPTPKSFLKKCVACSAEIPLAAETCYSCGKSQKAS